MMDNTIPFSLRDRRNDDMRKTLIQVYDALVDI